MEEIIQKIIQIQWPEPASSITRFETGLSHHVYEVVVGGESFVIRLAEPRRVRELKEGVRWHRLLESFNLPLPYLFDDFEVDDYAYAVYERLPGEDVEVAYASLDRAAKEHLAQQVLGFQQRISYMPRGYFKGVVPWPKYIEMILMRTDFEMRLNNMFPLSYVERLKGVLAKHEEYLHQVSNLPFLYDTNVRNVIMDGGKVTGIIDVDEVWLGDPLLAIGRGRTLLLMMGQDLDLIEFWSENLALTAFQEKMVKVYSLLYCVRFMGTLGQTLNGNHNVQTDPAGAPLLEALTEGLLAELG